MHVRDADDPAMRGGQPRTVESSAQNASGTLTEKLWTSQTSVIWVLLVQFFPSLGTTCTLMLLFKFAFYFKLIFVLYFLVSLYLLFYLLILILAIMSLKSYLYFSNRIKIDT